MNIHLILNNLSNIHLFPIRDDRIRMERRFSNEQLMIETIRAFTRMVRRMMGVLLLGTSSMISMGNTF